MDKISDVLNNLLHYMKGVEPFSKIITDLVRNRKKWCPFTHDDIEINHRCYHANPSAQTLISYVNKYAKCCGYLDVHPNALADIKGICNELSIPERMSSLTDFDKIIKGLKKNVAFVEPDVSNKLSRFSCLECQRLDEAIVCFDNYCFYASIVMAVSAVEARINEIIYKQDETLFVSHFSKATLGQLVQLFDEKHYKEPKFTKLKTSMPPKHRPLVNLINQYRVFSAHPKSEKVTSQIADAIIKLSFTFMVDPSTCVYDKKDLECH